MPVSTRPCSRKRPLAAGTGFILRMRRYSIQLWPGLWLMAVHNSYHSYYSAGCSEHRSWPVGGQLSHWTENSASLDSGVSHNDMLNPPQHPQRCYSDPDRRPPTVDEVIAHGEPRVPRKGYHVQFEGFDAPSPPKTPTRCCAGNTSTRMVHKHVCICFQAPAYALHPNITQHRMPYAVFRIPSTTPESDAGTIQGQTRASPILNTKNTHNDPGQPDHQMCNAIPHGHKWDRIPLSTSSSNTSTERGISKWPIPPSPEPKGRGSGWTAESTPHSFETEFWT